MWIDAEAQLDIYKNLMTLEKVPEVDFGDACVKACHARIACGYDLATLVIDGGEHNLGGVASDSWYDDEYSDGGGDDGDVTAGWAVKSAALKAGTRWSSTLYLVFVFFCAGVSMALCKIVFWNGMITNLCVILLGLFIFLRMLFLQKNCVGMCYFKLGRVYL